MKDYHGPIKHSFLNFAPGTRIFADLRELSADWRAHTDKSACCTKDCDLEAQGKGTVFVRL